MRNQAALSVIAPVQQDHFCRAVCQNQVAPRAFESSVNTIKILLFSLLFYGFCGIILV